MHVISTKDLLSLIVESSQNDKCNILRIEGSTIRILHQRFCQENIECDLSGYAFETVAYEFPSDMEVSNTEILICNKNAFLKSSNYILPRRQTDIEQIKKIINEILA